MYKTRTYVLGGILVAISLISSCKKDDASWDVNMVGPVAYTSLSIADLIPDSLLQVNPDSTVSLVYTDNVYTLDLDSLLNIPDTSLHELYQIPIVVAVEPGATFLTGTGNTQYEMQDAELYEAIVREGTVMITITSTIDQPTQFEYNITNATLLGVPFQVVIDIPAAVGGVPAVVNASSNLSGYHLDLRGPMFDSYNMMQTEYNANVHPAAPDSAHINGLADSVVLDYTFQGFVPEYARGYFGQKTMQIGPESAETGIFGIVESGTIDIDQCSVELEIINRFGVDGQAKANQLTSFNSGTSNAVNLSHSVIGSTINLSRAIDGGGYPIPTAHTELMTNGNSNIDVFIENLPDQLTYDLEFEINPLGNVSGGNDFFYYGNTFEANLNLDIPLCIIANQLTLADTTEFTFPDEPNGEVLDGTITVLAENGFPFSATMQLYMLDENKVLLDSLTTTDVILSGVVDASQVVIATTNSTVNYEVPAYKVSDLRKTKYLVLKPSFTTASLVQHTKIYDYYLLNLKVTTDFNYQYQGGE